MSQSDATSTRLPTGITIILVLVGIIMLPLIGRLSAGRSVQPYLQFPLITHSVTHEPFSWLIFAALAMLIAGAVVAFVASISRTKRCDAQATADPKRASRVSLRERRPPVGVIPWWGWLAVCWTLLAWLLAWTRFDWMRPFQLLTFTPLWLGYIVVVNALTFRRIGRCMMLHRARYFLSLFPLSAVFWWSFEYLNRFVQNWHYLGGQELTPWAYLWQATLPFATVLPAVLGTAELLTTFPRFTAALTQCGPVDMGHRTKWGWGLMGGAAAGLLGLGLWPDYLFSQVWAAPLLVIIAIQMIRGEPTIFDETARGDWQSVGAAAVAALICGFFWELWNFYSVAHWEYTVPFVQRFELFHMPLLGYAGYLPFGLECLAVADLCLNRKFSAGAAYYRAPVGGTDLAQRKPTVAER